MLLPPEYLVCGKVMFSVMSWPVQTWSLGRPSIHLLAGGLLAFNWKAFLFIYIFQCLFLILISEDKSTLSSTKWIIHMTQNMKLAQAGVGYRYSLESKKRETYMTAFNDHLSCHDTVIVFIKCTVGSDDNGSYTFCTNDHPTISIHCIMVCSHWRCPTPG